VRVCGVCIMLVVMQSV